MPFDDSTGSGFMSFSIEVKKIALLSVHNHTQIESREHLPIMEELFDDGFVRADDALTSSGNARIVIYSLTKRGKEKVAELLNESAEPG